jgi:perosamine synthetase
MSDFDIATIVNAIRSVLPDDGSAVALHEPEFAGNEWDYVKECLDTRWVSSVGRFVDRFERDLADVLGVRRAVAVVNGTAALHICLLLAGVSRGDEVVIPTLTFVATANAVTYVGAIPHLADSADSSLGLDPKKLNEHLEDIAEVRSGVCMNRVTNRRIVAVVPVHTFGHPVDLETLKEVCERWHLVMIEDAAESLGSTYRGVHCGNYGRISAISFNGNKIATTGGGGAIVTNDSALGEIAKHITTTARVKHQWEFLHDRVGFNYRMPNINAALGCAQLEQLPRFLERKRALAEAYAAAFAAVKGVQFVEEPAFARSNYWLNAIRLDEAFAAHRDEVLMRTNDCGVSTRPAWTLMHRLPMYEPSPRMDLSTSERIAATLINLPSSAYLAGASLRADS